MFAELAVLAAKLALHFSRLPVSRRSQSALRFRRYVPHSPHACSRVNTMAAGQCSGDSTENPNLLLRRIHGGNGINFFHQGQKIASSVRVDNRGRRRYRNSQN